MGQAILNLPDKFTFSGISTRVIFGFGTISALPAEIERLGRKRVLIVSTTRQEAQAQAISSILGTQSVGTFSGAAMHTPTAVTDEALTVFSSAGADCVVAIGGGSTTGLAKAIATRTGADQIIIPTTYAGSEMTDILGETQDGEKRTRRDASIQPETVIYDVDLTMSLPSDITATSALNSIAHAVEALYAVDRNPIISLLATECVRVFTTALPRIAADPRDREARRRALYGAWLGGIALGGASMSLHHKICHTLGGSFGTPHAETHAIMLPHTVGFNAVAVPELLQPIADILGARPDVGLFDLAERIGAPARLKDFGLDEADLDYAADLATKNPYENPRPIDRDAIRLLLQNAWNGQRPAINT